MIMHDYQPTDNLLTGRIILITGAGSGIGRYMALEFAKLGATVILLGRSLRKLETLYDEIEQQNGPQPAIYPMNLESATLQDYDVLTTTLTNEFGRLDGLLHNAALLGTLSPIQHHSVELWYRIMQVNLHAPFLLTKACLPLLSHSADASILFTSSNVAKQGKAYWGGYAVSKWGLEGLMQVLADELENSSIRVNSINPGAIRTALRAIAYPGEDPMTLPTPEVLRTLYLYLIGPDSRGITGQAFELPKMD